MHMLRFAMVNLATKFEVFISTFCEGMKGEAKCGNTDGLGYLGVTQGHRKWHHSAKFVRKKSMETTLW